MAVVIIELALGIVWLAFLAATHFYIWVVIAGLLALFVISGRYLPS